MPSFRRIGLIGCVGVLPLLAPLRAQPAPDGRAKLVALVVAVQEADYRGDLGRLRSLAAEMQPYTTEPSLAAAARYWRGFAHWRHALNRLGDGTPGDSVDQDFAASILEFREALAINPADIEAQIGLAAGLQNRAYFSLGAPERAATFVAELAPLLRQIRGTAPNNPRMMFVVAPSLFWAPPGRGGDKQQALALLERGIRLAPLGTPSADSLAPGWGEAELHMLLGWFSLNLEPADSGRALRHAEAALALRPEWRYVRDNLLPQIRQRVRSGPAGATARPRAKITTVAYRVHRMPAMLAFYREAFGVQFREVDTGGIRSQFGEVDGITLKFVPIRDAVDFENFPAHQLGFEVPEVNAVVAAARKHGGRVQDAPRRQDGQVVAAIRDPDGNTLELYGSR